MKKTVITGISVLLCLCIFPVSGIFAQNKTDKYLGQRSDCLGIIKIKETRILDDQTILFEMDGGEVYISRLPNYCSGLKMADSFSYSTSLNKLCKHDIITVLEESLSVTSSCSLGEFIKLKGVKRINDAVKLLREQGVLESLVEEGAFETAFPASDK